MKQQKAKLFQNGRSQAVRLPVEFRFTGNEVYIRQDETTGDVILSARPDAGDFWREYFSRPREVADDEAKDFMADRDRSLPQDRDDLF